jgi:SAM-dependent methyltransferase
MDLPYFDRLLEDRRRGSRGVEVFSRHVHWGLWPRLRAARIGEQDFVRAMERLDDTVVGGAAISDGMTIADVGCGFGGTVSRLADRFPDARLVGLNIDIRQLNEAVKSRADLVCADGCALPLAAESVDAVLAVECIFHFRSRAAFLREAARVLRPGGRLSLSDFVPPNVTAAKNRGERWVEDQVGRGYGSLTGWEDGDYAAMAAAAGLVVERDVDLTAHTLPTYLFLLRNSGRQVLARESHPPILPTALLFALSAAGAVRYRTIVLRKPEA